MNILTKILNDKRVEIDGRIAAVSTEAMREAALAVPTRPSMASALDAAPMGLIAEVKYRSPSAGVIRDPFEPGSIAQSYEAGGAHACSVLVDHAYFGGGEAFFQEVRGAVELPLLYKEFVVDPWQVWHARQIGASAVLLIAAALEEAEAALLMDLCAEAGLEVLFEVHDADEMAMARRLRPKMCGINNRNLKTFVTTLDTTRDLREQAPDGSLLISESGIRTNEDVQLLASWDIDGILVGEHLLRKPELADAVRDLLGTA